MFSQEDLFGILAEAVFAGSNLFSYDQMDGMVCDIAEALACDDVYMSLKKAEKKLEFLIEDRMKECLEKELKRCSQGKVVSITLSYKKDAYYITLFETYQDIKNAMESHISQCILQYFNQPEYTTPDSDLNIDGILTVPEKQSVGLRH